MRRVFRKTPKQNKKEIINAINYYRGEQTLREAVRQDNLLTMERMSAK
jgi:hypothetical protein